MREAELTTHWGATHGPTGGLLKLSLWRVVRHPPSTLMREMGFRAALSLAWWLRIVSVLVGTPHPSHVKDYLALLR